MEIKECEHCSIKIYIAGDYDLYRNICRKFCFHIGLCVNIRKCDYIYTGGEETGVIVELINYARFPSNRVEIKQIAIELAFELMDEGCQTSFSITDGDKSYFYSIRKDD